MEWAGRFIPKFQPSGIRTQHHFAPYMFSLLLFTIVVLIYYGTDIQCPRVLQGLPLPGFSALGSGSESGPERLPFALRETEGSCDLFKGKWVWNNVTHPLYKEEDCPYIDSQLSCHANGRPDNSYQFWRWQPDGCDLPSFNATLILESIRGKRMLFVGDSLNRGQFFSMVCLVQSLIPESERSMEYHDSLITFQAKSYNATIELYWAPFLLESNSDNILTHKPRERIVRKDSIEKHGEHWKGADIMIFNTYIWWQTESDFKVLEVRPACLNSVCCELRLRRSESPTCWLLQCCCGLRRPTAGCDCWLAAACELVMLTTLLKVYVRGGLFEKAKELLAELEDLDGYAYSIMISAFCRAGLLDEAKQIAIDFEASSEKFDVVILNTMLCAYCRAGAWEGSFEDERQHIVKLSTDEAYRMGIKSMLNWVKKNMDTKKTRVFFTSMSPYHIMSAEWGGKEGGNCYNETTIISDKTYWGSECSKSMMQLTKDEFAKSEYPVTVLNITQLSSYRKDAHLSIYKKHWVPLTPEQVANPISYADCVHFCLPGLQDTWNELLFAKLFYP
ncbi:unnamed protein product [Rhodiola kirilowii]